MSKPKIFLAGSFHTKAGEQMMERIYKLLMSNGYPTWWAPVNLKGKRGYGIHDISFLEKIIPPEEKAIEESEVFIAVMERATFGTAMEIKHAFDHGKKIIGYVLNDSPDFESAAFNYRVRTVVKSEGQLLDALK